jgi:uncharacterized repeat protein (TIGR02543 family)
MKLNKKTGLGTFFLIALASLALITCKAIGSNGIFQNGDASPVKIWLLTFDADGGEPVPIPVPVANGETIDALPDALEKSPSTFGGWYLGDSLFDPEKPITGNITLRAKWISPALPGHFHVTFDGSGGSPATYVAENVSENDKINPLPAVTRSGYNFGGWYTAKNGDGTEFTTATAVTASVTLHAKWTAITYTVSYNATSGTGSMTGSIHTYGVKKRLTATGSSISFAGHTFEGWAASAGSKQWDYGDNEEVLNLSNTQGATVPLYAVWAVEGGTSDGSGNQGGTGLPPETGEAPPPESGVAPPSLADAVPFGNYLGASLTDDTGDITVTIAGDETYTVSGISGLAGTYKLADDGIDLTGLTDRAVRVISAGTINTAPLQLKLKDASVQTATSPIALSNVYEWPLANPSEGRKPSNVRIWAEGENTLSSSNARDYPAIHVPQGSMLELVGPAGSKINASSVSTAMTNGYAEGTSAAIGGRGAYSHAFAGVILEDAGTIVISGTLEVHASVSGPGYVGAAIGGGGSTSRNYSTGGSGGTITIQGNVTVYATVSGKGAAGIGGGGGPQGNGSKGSITIKENARVYSSGGTDGTGWRDSTGATGA